MKRAKCLVAWLVMLCITGHLCAKEKVDWVNPIIGTNGMGHTFPGACVPFGLVQLSPDTDTIPHNIDGKYQPRVYEYCAGYQHKDSSIVGFSHTHFSGTGHSDLGDLLLMPTTGELMLNPGTATDPDGGYRSRFSHETEISRPGYYEVMLADYGVKAQLTATQRVGVHKYSYPKQANQLAENKISWIDRAGNCDIRHENLLIKVVGQKNNTAFKVTATCKISETSMKIILFFLQHPDNINLSYRDIQDKVGYSLGSITKVFDLLKANNYLVQTENGRKIANNFEKN